MTVRRDRWSIHGSVHRTEVRRLVSFGRIMDNDVREFRLVDKHVVATDLDADIGVDKE